MVQPQFTMHHACQSPVTFIGTHMDLKSHGGTACRSVTQTFFPSLTASAGFAGWVEMLMLRKTLNSRIGHTGLDLSHVAKLWSAAIAGAAAAWFVKIILPSMHPALTAVFVLGTYGVIFLGITLLFRIPEAVSLWERLRKGTR